MAGHAQTARIPRWTSTYVFAAAQAASFNLFFVLIAVLHTVVNGGGRRWRALLVVVAAVALVTTAWMVIGDRALGASPLHFAEPMKAAFSLEFINEVFDVAWRDPAAKVGYLLWNVLGPFRVAGQLLVAMVVVLAIALLRHLQGTRSGGASAPSVMTAFTRTSIATLVASFLIPWGIYKPSELTFLDFRLMAIACCLMAAAAASAARGDWMAGSRAAHVVGTACAVLVVHFGARAAAFGAEARPVLRLLEKAPVSSVMMTVAFHNRSEHFGKQFRLTHFLPMYFTIRHGGINSQFWAAYTEHLPVGYRQGKQPAAPPDWRPHELSVSHLVAGSGLVLFQRATADSAARDRQGSRAAETLLRSHADLIACDGSWCLYLRKDS